MACDNDSSAYILGQKILIHEISCIAMATAVDMHILISLILEEYLFAY